MQLQFIGRAMGVASGCGWFLQMLLPHQAVTFFVALNVLLFWIVVEVAASSGTAPRPRKRPRKKDS